MPTLADVARQAGVTTATVSNVLTGRVAVRDTTRARVLQAVEELGYHPNLVARSLSSGKTFTIALIVPTITNPFFSEVVEEAERIAEQHDYQLLLCTTHNQLELSKSNIERMASRWVDGFIVMGMAVDIEDVLTVAARGKPVVLSVWNQDPRAQAVPIVDIDFRYAGELGTQHLIALGHRHIAAIVEMPVQQSRLDGYKIALAAADIPFVPEYVIGADSSFESGYHGAVKLFQLAQPPTALFVGNDLMALGAIEALNQLRLRVPEDVSVVGVDDIILAQYAHPPLTTISIPKKEMARSATDLLLRRINAMPQDDKTPHMMLVRPHLVQRQSTSHPPA
jgi:DNA-binding LacI/PurR family transcriptional regulator